MDRARFTNADAGTLVPTIEGQAAFCPAPLPPRLDIGDFWKCLSQADRALGRLAGVSATLSKDANPYLLINPFVKREAVLSSRIEGTETSFQQVYLFDVEEEEPTGDADLQEVVNYIKAHQFALKGDHGLPISKRLIRRIHGILMEGARGGRKKPGEFRTEQNWLGVEGCKIKDARFVPPPPAKMMECLDDLEKFIHTDSGIPPLVRLGLIHYQFETIHPFFDGNGRIGRMLISLMVCELRLLTMPLLYVSAFFERRRGEYQRRLFDVSAKGDWSGWLAFFLEGVESQARDACKRAEMMLELRRSWNEKVSTARSSILLGRIIDELFARPMITTTRAMKVCGVTRPAVIRHIDRLRELKILREAPKRGRSRRFVAEELLNLADRELEEEPG